MAWDDIDSPVALVKAPVALAEDPIARIRAFDSAWEQLSPDQREFLTVWKKARFNKSRALRNMGDNAPNMSTEWRWHKNEHYAFVFKVLKIDAVGDILEKERLVLRQDDCAEQLLEPKPILYQGAPTGFYETEAAAAAKVNETLLRVGGHLRDEQASAPTAGPALIVQVTNKIGGEVISRTVVGVVPEQVPPDEAWLGS